jgi:hypothetical protein
MTGEVRVEADAKAVGDFPADHHNGKQRLAS